MDSYKRKKDFDTPWWDGFIIGVLFTLGLVAFGITFFITWITS